MKIFAIDASSDFCTISILSNGKEIFAQKLRSKITECLFDALELLNLHINQPDYIAVCTGPGGYTSVRASIAAMHGIAIGANKKLLCASAFEVFAHKFFIENRDCEDGEISVLLQSYSQQFLYCQKISRSIKSCSAPCKINPESSEAMPTVGNASICNYKIEISAYDVALFAQEKLKDGHQFAELQAIYVN